MPIFEYNCEHCHYTFDKLVMRQNADVNCPLCQGEVKKLMSTFAVGAADNDSSKMPTSPIRPMCTTC
jgi:putative FmdB family regulatory protein